MLHTLRRWSGALLLLVACTAHAQTWTTTLQARDVNSDGVTDAYYDTVLDITWLREWDVTPTLPNWDPQTNPNYQQLSLDFAANLSLLGVDDWRLPGAYNFNLAGHPDEAVSGSEISFLYFVTLGLGNTDCPSTPACSQLLFDGSLFHANASDPWVTSNPNYGFSFEYPGAWGIPEYGILGSLRNITVVRDGDIALAVPEPSTYALMALGLLAVGAAARRHRTR